MNLLMIEKDRELLLAARDRNHDGLPLEVCLAVGAAADELTDPEVLPTLFPIDPADTANPLEVIRAVRDRLQLLCGTLPVAETMACARAARELTTAEQLLTAGGDR